MDLLGFRMEFFHVAPILEVHTLATLLHSRLARKLKYKKHIQRLIKTFGLRFLACFGVLIWEISS